MARRARFAIASLFASVLLSCGGGSATHDAGTTGTAGAGTAGAGAGGAGGTHVSGTGNFIGSGTGTAGVTGTAGSGTAGTGAGGAPMPTGSLVFQGMLPGLLSQGPPCTFEVGATGDRWCGFITPYNGTPATLYVVNVSKAAAGTSITCGATDANCLRLTDSFTEDNAHAAFFQGDTLIYYDGTWSPFGWRPGMTAGRQLLVADATTMDVAICTAALKGTAAICLRALPTAMQTDTTLLLADLLAGKIDDAATPPLVRVDQVIAVNTNLNVAHFHATFPIPGTDTIAWSSQATKTGPEILKMQTLGNDASRVTVASNVNRWRTSPDGTRWYWLSAVADATGAGALQSAPYPAGTAPTAIATNVLDYDFPATSSLLTLDTAKNLRVVADPIGAPTAAQSLDTGVIGLITLSPQGHVAYAKTATTTNGVTFANMYVKKSDGTGVCAITTATDGYPASFAFTPDLGGVTWIQRGSTQFLARYTRLSDCMSATSDSAAGIIWTEPVGNRGVLVVDSYDGVETGALQFYEVAAGNTLSTNPPTMISGQVGFWQTLAAGGADVVLYTVDGGGNDDGVYVRAFGP